MTSATSSIIEGWNNKFRCWSEENIAAHKLEILEACCFGNNKDLENGHKSALNDISKNKGNISEFVLSHTPSSAIHLLPSKMLESSYSFNKNNYIFNNYNMIYCTSLNNFISWKPGTNNALSCKPLEFKYNNEYFTCKFRKYQLESMKKFIQATPGTKEIRGQWSCNLPNDYLLIKFGPNNDLIVTIKIGCNLNKLLIMYNENSVLRKNSKIRKQTLKTSCWGIEKTNRDNQFRNSIIIQENYSIDINADNILKISPIIVYIRKNKSDYLMKNCVFSINNCDINIHQKPYYITNITSENIKLDNENELRLKYRNNLLNRGATKKQSKHVRIKKENKKNKIKRNKAKRTRKWKQILNDDNNNNNNCNTISNNASTLSAISVDDNCNITPQDPVYNTLNDDQFNDNNYTTTTGGAGTIYDNQLMDDTMNISYSDPLLSAPNPINYDNSEPFNWTLDNDIITSGGGGTIGGGITSFPSFDDNTNTNTNNGFNFDVMDIETDNTNLFTNFYDQNTNNTNNNQQTLNSPNNNTEMSYLRNQNEMLRQTIEDQRRQIQLLTEQIRSLTTTTTTATTNYQPQVIQQPTNYHYYSYNTQPYNIPYNTTINPNINNTSNQLQHRSYQPALKRRRIAAEALLPPAA